MKVSMPVWGSRISPVLDTTLHLLVADVENNGVGIKDRQVLTLVGLKPYERIEKILSQSCDLLICGGVTFPLLQNLKDNGVNVVPFLCGDVDNILESIAHGENLEEKYAMP